MVRQPEAADVAGPRPREVGGACRRQVLAGARTQETVGGPNGAQRSEFRRNRLPAVLHQIFGHVMSLHEAVTDFGGRDIHQRGVQNLDVIEMAVSILKCQSVST